jgi:hypothetical protein
MMSPRRDMIAKQRLSRAGQESLSDHVDLVNRFGVVPDAVRRSVLGAVGWNQFFPRLGLAWDPKGDGLMSVRVAVGMFSDRAQVTSLTGFGQNTPYGDVISLTNVPLSNPWATYPGGNPLPLPLQQNLAFPLQSAYLTQPSHLKPTAVQQWNLSIQRQIRADWLLTANYGSGAKNRIDSRGAIIAE